MTKYTILDFKMNGLAGGVKLMLDYLKVPFEDKGFEFHEWPAIKPSKLFGTDISTRR